MALLNPCMKFKNFFCQKTSFEALWKCHLQKIFITFSRVRQIQDLGQSKYKLRLFSKRTHGISKILFNLCSCEFLARLESKIRKCLFFDGSLLQKYSVKSFNSVELGLHTFLRREDAAEKEQWSGWSNIVQKIINNNFLLCKLLWVQIVAIFHNKWNSMTSKGYH